MEKIIKQIANELGIKDSQVSDTIKLIDDGNTIPFIARYRKEVTGNLRWEIKIFKKFRRKKRRSKKTNRWTRKINRRIV